jgi:GGDEF domain-containing protein
VARWGGDQFAVLIEGPDTSGASADSFGAGVDSFGAGADNFRTGADRFGTPAGRFVAGADRFVAGEGTVGAGADRIGAGTGSHPSVPDVAERLARCVPSEPFRLGNRDVTVTVSVGVAFADGGPASQVWRRAELAMARARELGGDRVEVFHDAPPGTGPASCGPPEAAAARAAAQ